MRFASSMFLILACTWPTALGCSSQPSGDVDASVSDAAFICSDDAWLAHVPEECHPAALGRWFGDRCNDPSLQEWLQGGRPTEGGIQHIDSACNSSTITQYTWVRYDACIEQCEAETFVEESCLGFRIICQPGSCEGQPDCICGPEEGHKLEVTFQGLQHGTYYLASADATMVMGLDLLADGDCIYEDGWFGAPGYLVQCEAGERTFTELPCE